MVAKTRQRCVEEGVEAALNDRPRPDQNPKLTDRQAAHMIAIACSDAPDGHDHWTLRLLADKELDYAESCSYETIRQLLKNTLKPWQQRAGCIPKVSAEYVAAIEDVLDLTRNLDFLCARWSVSAKARNK